MEGGGEVTRGEGGDVEETTQVDAAERCVRLCASVCVSGGAVRGWRMK